MNLPSCIIWLVSGERSGCVVVQADGDIARFAVLVGEYAAVSERVVADDEDPTEVVAAVVSGLLVQVCGFDPTWEIVSFDGETLHLAEWLADSVAVGDA